MCICFFKCTLSPFESKSHCVPDKDAASSPDIQAPPSLNPFDGMKSEDEEEELAVADRREEEEDDEEVDEAELEAFLDGQLADRLPFLQERSRQGIAFENPEHNMFCIPSSKGEDALRTCKFQITKTHFLTYPWWYPVMQVVLILSAQVLRYVSQYCKSL